MAPILHQNAIELPEFQGTSNKTDDLKPERLKPDQTLMLDTVSKPCNNRPAKPMQTMPAPNDSVLPPLPPGHGFEEGDRVEIPVYGKGRIQGTIKHIDMCIGRKRYQGFVVVADQDGIFYELHPELAQHIPSVQGSNGLSKTKTPRQRT
jgi:hypothetical protein